MSFSNKIKGCPVGYAIGDALGRGTEFMTAPEVSRRYPDGLRSYDAIIRDAVRSRFRRGDFTGDTTVVLSMTESLIERNGIDYLDFARRYKEWFDTQAPEDSDSHMRMVLQHPDFLTDPHAASKSVYEQQALFEAPNEALGRAVLIGLWPGSTEKDVRENCQVTHWDYRCVASCVIIATMANELLWHRREADYDRLTGIASRLDKRVLPYLEAAREGELDDFDLDDEDTYWYVRKNMGAALWSMWHHTDPEEALYDVIRHGGDANGNAALTMGLMGLKYGFSRLPAHLVEALLELDRVTTMADRLITSLQNADTQRDTDE